MSDEPRKTGRPPLKSDDKSVDVTVKFPSRDLDDLWHLRWRQRKELAGAAGGKQTGDVIAAEPVHIGAVGLLVEGIVGPERRHGKGQEAGADLVGHLLRGHLAHRATP